MEKKIGKPQTLAILCLLVFVFSFGVYMNRASSLFAVGNFYFGGKFYDLDKAMFFYNLALAKDPLYRGVHYQMGRIYFLRSDFNRAIDEINQEIAIEPDFKRSYYIRGLVYGYQKDFKKAEEDFLTFLAWKPDSWAGHNDLSWVYFQEGDYVNAEKYAREGLEKDPHNPWLLNSLGIALLNEEKYEEAEKNFAEGLMVFRSLPSSVWGKAYPGNNADIYNEGYSITLSVIEKNLELAKKRGK